MSHAWEGPAFCRHARVHVPGAPRGPLAGLRFAAKDVFAVEGVRACYGNPHWLETHAPARETAPAVLSLLAAGADLVGLTLTDELALSLSGENAHYGTPPNPRAPGRVPGGSSCGSASAVASCDVDFALGTDTGGSVRVPASFCGLYGLRPTHGAIDSAGVLPLAPSLDTVGVFTCDLEVLSRVIAVLQSTGVAELPGRLCFPREAEALVAPAAWRAFLAASEELARKLGKTLEAVSLPAWPGASFEVYLSLQNRELAAHHRDFAGQAEFGSLIGRRIGWALAGGPLSLEDAEQERARIVEPLLEILASAWLVLPSAPDVAPLRGLDDDSTEAWTGRGLRLSALASLSGCPQLSLPLATVDELPFGISLLGPRGSDRALIASVGGNHG